MDVPASASHSAADTARGGSAEACACDAPEAELTARHLRMLAELGDIGMELARDLRPSAPDADRAGAGQNADPGVEQRVDAALAYTRVARAVRQTVALAARLTAEARERGRQDVLDEAVRSAAERRRTKQKTERIRKLVEDAIASEADTGDAEGLRLDLDERLDDPEIEDELGRRPIGVVVLRICRDLGVDVDLRHFSDAELGFDIALAGQAGGSVPSGEVGAEGVTVTPTPGPSPQGREERYSFRSGGCSLDLDDGADTGDPPSG